MVLLCRIQKVITASIFIGVVVLLAITQALQNHNNAGSFPPAFSCIVQAADNHCCVPANEPTNHDAATGKSAGEFLSYTKVTYRTDYPDNKNIYSQLCIIKHIGCSNFNNPSLQMAVFFNDTET